MLLAFFLCLPLRWGHAQTPEPEAAIYIVQPGDSLWTIAVRFRVSMAALAEANGISDPGQLNIGARLIIPGLEGVSGILTTDQVRFGETLESLSRRYAISATALARLNHLTSPSELYVGTSLVIPEQNLSAPPTRRLSLLPGQSLLEAAILNNANPWQVIQHNGLAGSWEALPTDVLHLPADPAAATEGDFPGALPAAIQSLTLQPASVLQGKTVEIKLAAPPGASFGGRLHDRPLNFFYLPEAGYISLQGVHAMLDPGIYALVITGTLPAEAPYGQEQFAFSQSVLIGSGGYPFDPVLIVDPDTIDPANTAPEDQLWRSLTSMVTPEKLWEGAFVSPVPPEFAQCYPSRFGSRRSYNGSAYTYFHTGLDFCGGEGTAIYAPAAGRVVYTGALTVRGNATVIDHGWGVFSAYMHQSEILVQTGDLVQAGQLIGRVGRTGRVTGPHLHLEIWVGGVQVDPLDWLSTAFP